MWQAGIDEAGRGSCLGPLIVGFVALPKDDIHLLKERGITDSKKISAAVRAELYDWLKNEGAARGWVVDSMVAEAVQIDDWMNHSSLTDMEIEMFAHLATQHLGVGAGSGGCLILDACDVNAEKFGTKVISRVSGWDSDKWNLVSEHAADLNHLVVGAASIIAKQERDAAIERLGEELSLAVGSGYPSDPHTQEALPILVSGDEPNRFLRWSWATIKSAWREAKGSDCPIRNAEEPLFRRPSLFDF